MYNYFFIMRNKMHNIVKTGKHFNQKQEEGQRKH